MNINVLKNLMKLKKISVKEVAIKLQMTEQGVYHLFKDAKDLKVKQLEAFAELLDVNISYFFQDETKENLNISDVNYQKIQGNNNSISNNSLEIEMLKKEISNLKNLLKEKDNHIASLQKLIDVLQKRL